MRFLLLRLFGFGLLLQGQGLLCLFGGLGLLLLSKFILDLLLFGNLLQFFNFSLHGSSFCRLFGLGLGFSLFNFGSSLESLLAFLLS